MRLFSLVCCLTWTMAGLMSCKNEVTACFSAPESAQPNQTVLITSCATYGRGDLTMNFGDGSPEREFNPLADTISHTYTDTGSFQLTMRAAYKSNSHNLTKTIRIRP